MSKILLLNRLLAVDCFKIVIHPLVYTKTLTLSHTPCSTNRNNNHTLSHTTYIHTTYHIYTRSPFLFFLFFFPAHSLLFSHLLPFFPFSFSLSLSRPLYLSLFLFLPFSLSTLRLFHLVRRDTQYSYLTL